MKKVEKITKPSNEMKKSGKESIKENKQEELPRKENKLPKKDYLLQKQLLHKENISCRQWVKTIPAQKLSG